MLETLIGYLIILKKKLHHNLLVVICYVQEQVWNGTAQNFGMHPAELGKSLRRELDLEIADLDAEGSKFFTSVYINPARVGAMVKEQDVINEIE